MLTRAHFPLFGPAKADKHGNPFFAGGSACGRGIRVTFFFLHWENGAGQMSATFVGIPLTSCLLRAPFVQSAAGRGRQREEARLVRLHSPEGVWLQEINSRRSQILETLRGFPSPSLSPVYKLHASTIRSSVNVGKDSIDANALHPTTTNAPSTAVSFASSVVSIRFDAVFWPFVM